MYVLSCSSDIPDNLFLLMTYKHMVNKTPSGMSWQIPLSFTFRIIQDSHSHYHVQDKTTNDIDLAIGEWMQSFALQSLGNDICKIQC